jgi:hypothetical protein
MTQSEILDIRRRAIEEAAQIAWDMAEQNRVSALKLWLKANKQAQLYDPDVADQTMISAQALDACAEEARCIYARILALKPRSPADFIEGGDDGVERNPVPHVRASDV